MALHNFYNKKVEEAQTLSEQNKDLEAQLKHKNGSIKNLNATVVAKNVELDQWKNKYLPTLQSWHTKQQDLQAEKKKLQEENDELQKRLVKLSALETENEKLKKESVGMKAQLSVIKEAVSKVPNL